MKRAIALILVIVSLFSFTACKNNNNPGTGVTNPTKTPATELDTEASSPETDPEITVPSDNVDEALFDLIHRIYEIQTLDFQVLDIEVDLTDEDEFKYYTGLDDASDVKAIAVSEGAMTTTAYSLVLLQLESDADAGQVAEAVVDGIDPRKWICVGAEDVKVVTQNDLVMLIMTPDETSASTDDLLAAFTEIRGEADRVLTK